MPPEPTAKSSRRRDKKFSVEELKDIEQKRLRGELSCAECRRLKLRCDKKVPCSSCVRRGCESICPCGILEAGVGTRFILASTNSLHSKISTMSARIRALEDALAIMQAAVSSDRHPLLEDDLLKIKFGAETLGEGKRSDEVMSPAEELAEASAATSSGDTKAAAEKVDTTALDTLGTLTLDEEGELKYFGRSAGSETMILAGEEYLEEDGVGSESDLQTASTPETFTSPASDALPPEIYALAAGTSSLSPGPNSPESSSQVGQDTLQSLLTHLPPRDRGTVLAQSYIDHATMFFRPLTKEDLLGDPSIPDQGSGSGVLTQLYTDSLSPTSHLVSAIFFVFALGAFFDLSLQNGKYIHESEMWFSLGMRAMTLGSGSDATMTNSAEDTVRALGLMATYITMTGRKYSRDSAWSGMSLAVKVAQGAGFHRDPERWGMDPRTVQKRRALWWEVFSADVSHSLALGRPPTVHLSFMDVEFPLDEDATINEEGGEQVVVDGFWRTKYKFSRDCFMQVINATLTAKAPDYATVLDLDRQVRECGLPPGFKPYVSIEEDGVEVYKSSGLALRDFYTSQFRTVTMLYLHRSFFAHAMLTFPSNPFLSPFAPSFLAAYRGASVIVKAAVHMFDRCAEMAGRVWFLTYHVFSAAVVLGTVVTRSPNSTLAPSALMDLNLAVELFEKCLSTSKRNRVAFVILKRLKEKAVKSYEGFCKEKDQTSSESSPQTQTQTQDQLDPNLFSPTPSTRHSHDSDVEDELELFGGQTRVLRAKKGAGRRKSGGVGVGGGVGASAPAPVSQQNTTNDDLVSMGMDSFDAAMGFGFGAGTTGTAMGGLNVAMDLDMGFASGSGSGEDSSSSLPPGDISKVHPSLVQYLNGGGMGMGMGMGEEPFMNWVPDQDVDTSMSVPWGVDDQMGTWGGQSLPQPQPPDKTQDERRLSELYTSFMDFLAQRHARPHDTFSRPGFSGLYTNTNTSNWNPPSSPSSFLSQNKPPFNHDHWSHLPPSSFERDFSFLAQTKGLRSFGGKSQAPPQPPPPPPPPFGMGFGGTTNPNPNRSALEDEFLSFMRRYVNSNGASGDNRM